MRQTNRKSFDSIPTQRATLKSSRLPHQAISKKTASKYTANPPPLSSYRHIPPHIRQNPLVQSPITLHYRQYLLKPPRILATASTFGFLLPLRGPQHRGRILLKLFHLVDEAGVVCFQLTGAVLGTKKNTDGSENKMGLGGGGCVCREAKLKVMNSD